MRRKRELGEGEKNVNILGRTTYRASVHQVSWILHPDKKNSRVICSNIRAYYVLGCLVVYTTVLVAIVTVAKSWVSHILILLSAILYIFFHGPNMQKKFPLASLMIIEKTQNLPKSLIFNLVKTETQICIYRIDCHAKSTFYLRIFIFAFEET